MHYNASIIVQLLSDYLPSTFLVKLGLNEKDIYRFDRTTVPRVITLSGQPGKGKTDSILNLGMNAKQYKTSSKSEFESIQQSRVYFVDDQLLNDVEFLNFLKQIGNAGQTVYNTSIQNIKYG